MIAKILETASLVTLPLPSAPSRCDMRQPLRRIIPKPIRPRPKGLTQRQIRPHSVVVEIRHSVIRELWVDISCR
jgi:hypothetical protein